MKQIPESKKQIVKEFVDLIKEYPIIAAVNMENLPTKQLQEMRAQLRDKVVLKMTKRRLMKITFDQAKQFKPGIEKMIQYLKGMPALLFTKNNPFALYKIIQKNKSPAPAKAGQIAPVDIVIPAGPTSFAPGPLIGELGMLGIKTGVEGGKIAVKEDKIVVKEGEEIKPMVAGLLTRFDIRPMEVGLDLTAAYEEGIIFTKKILHIDDEEYKQNLINASNWAFNLAIEVGYPTKETAELLVTKAYNNAKALAMSQEILNSETIEHILAKAESQNKNLKQKVDSIKLPEIKVEEQKEEIKTESEREEKIKGDSKENKETVKDEDIEQKEEQKEEIKTESEREEKIKEDSKENKETVKDEDIEQKEEQKEEIKTESERKEKIKEDSKENKETVKDEDIEKADKMIKQIQQGKLDIEIQPEEPKVPSAEQLVEELKQKDVEEQKKKEALKVPTAHELLQKKLEKEKKGE